MMNGWEPAWKLLRGQQEKIVNCSCSFLILGLCRARHRAVPCFLLWTQSSSNVRVGIALEFGASIAPTACTAPAVLTILLVFNQVTEKGFKTQFVYSITNLSGIRYFSWIQILTYLQDLGKWLILLCHGFHIFWNRVNYACLPHENIARINLYRALRMWSMVVIFFSWNKSKAETKPFPCYNPTLESTTHQQRVTH